MCGITGFIDSETRGREDASQIVRQMTCQLAHRGPDADGFWIDPGNCVALGHRRLSIIDLSPAGAQPMLSKSGRYTIIFNGEIYNFADLRDELESHGHEFRGHSDTEVMLAAFEQWGIPEGTKRLNGMFAFAVWDSADCALTLARDRMGEKPLYYGWSGPTFLFGSELKAIRVHPRFQPAIDADALHLYLSRNNVPAPRSIYKSVSKLEPGCLLRVSPRQPGKLQLSKFWDLRTAARAGISNRFTGAPEEVVESTEHLLRDAIRRQMIADVPLGAFLSGGLDSTTIVALMQAQSTRPVKTFTIGFDEGDFNEAPYARAVAEHLRTDHTELILKPEQALDIIPRLPEIYDEPFSDSSQIPTVVVAQLARKHVTVALSGDAGDELFSGYMRYRAASDVWNSIRYIPLPIRRLLSAGARSASSSSALQSLITARARKYGRRGGGREQLDRAVASLSAQSRSHLYRTMTALLVEPRTLLNPALQIHSDLEPHIQVGDFLDDMMFEDQFGYLPGDILHKVDRACMAASLESRIPMLDYRLVEHSWRIPNNLKLRNGVSKWVLREIVYKYVPRNILERHKSGFAVPIRRWLQNELRDWAEALLDSCRLEQQGFFNVASVREKWNQHRSGEQNWEHQLWGILMFQAWLDSQSQRMITSFAPEVLGFRERQFDTSSNIS